eukprot:scpid76417/ scgid26434/ 
MRALLACVGTGSCLVLAILWFVSFEKPPPHYRPSTGQHQWSNLSRQTGPVHVFIRRETQANITEAELRIVARETTSTLNRATVTRPSKTSTPASSKPSRGVDPVGDNDILYFVKACKRFQQRSLRLYQAWGNKVANVIFSTDQLLDGIPKRLQRIEAFDQPGDVSFQKEAEHWFHAASCGTTWINLGKVLLEEDCMNILIKVDDIR